MQWRTFCIFTLQSCLFPYFFSLLSIFPLFLFLLFIIFYFFSPSYLFFCAINLFFLFSFSSYSLVLPLSFCLSCPSLAACSLFHFYFFSSSRFLSTSFTSSISFAKLNFLKYLNTTHASSERGFFSLPHSSLYRNYYQSHKAMSLCTYDHLLIVLLPRQRELLLLLLTYFILSGSLLQLLFVVRLQTMQ